MAGAKDPPSRFGTRDAIIKRLAELPQPWQLYIPNDDNTQNRAEGNVADDVGDVGDVNNQGNSDNVLHNNNKN